jgi:hypothetical protein
MILYFSIVSSASCMIYVPSFPSLLDSGHGGQTKDLDGDEGDGFDEGCFYFYFDRFS